SLPKRSALVAFSANDVYELAERVRRRHGGAAVVLGALSPRARNAQVALYQAGEVQHMVATDAIGMGLNMDLDHVCFSEVRKFDGRTFRDLTPAELAQIAGRAGRFRRDGSFSTLNHLGPLPPEVVEAIEQHRFAPARKLYWRSSELDFRSLDTLLDSLDAPPRHPALIQVRDWSDHETLRALAQEPELRALLRGEEAVRLAWEVCQIPDFRKTLTGAHVGLLAQLLRYLLGPTRRLPEDWVRGRIDALDRPEGDIDALMTRIAWIRTWNYISFHPRWLEDDRAWQARCQEVEDRLSDTLHARLTERFVTGRVRHVHVEGLPGAKPRAARGPGGRLEGLRYKADLGAPPLQGEALLAVREELARRVSRLEAAEPEALELDARGTLRWEGGALARLVRGPRLGAPTAQVEPLPLLDEADRDRVSALVDAWLQAWLQQLLEPLRRPARGRLSKQGALIADAVEAGLGAAPTPALSGPLAGLGPRDRRLLAQLDLRLGRHTVYVANLTQAETLADRALLWAVYEGLDRRPALPEASVVLRDRALPREYYEAIGYVVLGHHALRADEAESLAARARGLARRGGFRVPRRWIQRLGTPEAAGRVLLDLGFLPDREGAGESTWRLAGG
ncbi:MAG: disulfide oxidoreductase, partial [Alphaproteobacteria bacterium]|nr:disulfide oxidoreductase [Alphaproteobacteria bacterium]